ncbi:unnamed protein product, partial [Closterium sp. Yama58-4]
CGRCCRQRGRDTTSSPYGWSSSHTPSVGWLSSWMTLPLPSVQQTASSSLRCTRRARRTGGASLVLTWPATSPARLLSTCPA